MTTAIKLREVAYPSLFARCRLTAQTSSRKTKNLRTKDLGTNRAGSLGGSFTDTYTAKSVPSNGMAMLKIISQ